MRSLVTIIALCCAAALQAQTGLVINEVQAANRTTLVSSKGATPDWIELYNPDRRARSLKGMRLRLGTRVHHFEQELHIPARGHLLLFADERPADGPEHLGFRLERTGGSLLLLDNDGTSILDVFTYGPLPTDRSMGRLPDGHTDWSFFVQPSPGRSNQAPSEGPLRGISKRPELEPPPGHYASPPHVRITVPEGCSLYLTHDGADPQSATAGTSTALNAFHGTVLRAITRCPGMLESEEQSGTYTIGPPESAPLALIAAPDDLWSDERGILTEGLHDNYSRGGVEWERRVLVQAGGGTSMPAGLRVSGSGSRGLAKRSFKLYARDRHGSPDSAWTMADGSRCDELMLRADASPHAFLANQLMDVLVQRGQLALTMQPARSQMVLLNGKPWGLYRAMPPKDAQWLRQRAGAEAVDVLEGPSFSALNGNDAHFQHALELLQRQAPLDSLGSYLDVTSLLDLASVDLFTGRADHELNVRCYRPRQAGGRWRWVLFDLDLWAPPTEPSVMRMLGGDPLAAPFLPLLLKHPQLQPMLLARVSTLLATIFHPTVAARALDSLYQQHRTQLEADHARWRTDLDNPPPQASLAHLHTHLSLRPAALMQQLASASGRQLEHLQIEVPSAKEGAVLLNGVALPEGRQRIAWFKGVPATLVLMPNPGYVVERPLGAEAGQRLVLNDAEDVGKLRLRFRFAGP
ncbi:MAG: CotH kinase family protein [Flavobacteriales bacterium]